MIEKIAFVFFILAYYIVLVRVVNYMFPGFIALSSLGALQIAVLIALIVPCVFLAKKTLNYLIK
ncbi:MAG: hypothetical protein E7483_07435 [Ruminococcaceae bacterium]|nr:hypothetical protein [Oscillospiraceae bacterium]